MSQILVDLVHRFGRQVRVNGVLCISSNGDRALLAAFKELGWPDPCPLDYQPKRAVVEAATVEAPERAALNIPERSIPRRKA